jgi:diguanylate cyclase (GGDEF)-like protein/PAS domain S-box-containing protein
MEKIKFEDRLKILLVDDDEEDFLILQDIIQVHQQTPGQLWLEIEWVSNYDSAVQVFTKDEYDVYLIDYRLGNRNGLDLLREAKTIGCKSPVIMLTGTGNYDIDLQAMQEGAADYLVKDQLTPQLLERSIRYSLIQKKVQEELERRVQKRTRELAKANQELQLENTRRKQAEETLRESEAKFRALANTTSAAILIVQDYKIQYANPATSSITGYSPEELINTNILKLLHPVYRKSITTNGFATRWAADIPARYELKIVTKNDKERWVDVSAGDMQYQGKHAVVLTSFDITERDLAERELRKAKEELEDKVEERTRSLYQRAEELNALHNAASSLLNTLDLDALIEKIMVAVKNVFPSSEHCLLLLQASDGKKLQLRGSVGGGDIWVNKDLLSTHKGYASQAILEKKTVHFPGSISTEPGIGIKRAKTGQNLIRSIIAAPLLSDSEALGALCLSSKRAEAFNDSDLRLLESFAATISAALQNAYLYSQVQKMAVTDALTGLLNRRGFFESANREIERFHRFKRPLSILLLDVDKFKSINDRFGHGVGDVILQSIAEICLQNTRQIDIVGRLGGDEFAILLPEADIRKANQIAERISNAICRSPLLPEIGISTTASIGVGVAHSDSQDLESLLIQADADLYNAKTTGYNWVALK